MKSFGADQVDDIIQYVTEDGGNMTVQDAAGDTLAIFEDHSRADKEAILREYCRMKQAPFKVFPTEKR